MPPLPARGKGLGSPSPPRRRGQRRPSPTAPGPAPRTGEKSPVSPRSPQRRPGPARPSPTAAGRGCLPPFSSLPSPVARRPGRLKKAGRARGRRHCSRTPLPPPRQNPPACCTHPQRPARQRRRATPASALPLLGGVPSCSSRSGRRARQLGSGEAERPRLLSGPGACWEL